ncbi:MAG: hypothetical protein AAGB93_09440 [Planctomycetota bacterium]
MDALALLCTLHADGPTSLKRLRTGGCGTIATLVERTPEDVAALLEIERAVARRLLREARILSDRIGVGSLDVEEAPPALGRNGAAASPPVPSVAPAPQASELDAIDRALVARVSRPEPASVEPDFVEPVSTEPRVEEPRVEEPPVEQPVAEEPVVQEPAESVPQEPAPEQEPERPGALRGGVVPGLDGGMVEDLRGLEISTFEELARADSLTLTRGLGITFAQARRLRFLARRAAEETVEERWIPSEVPPAPEAAPVVEEPAPVDPATEASESEQLAPTDPVMADLDEDAQGVPVDPSEIAARPTFAEQFARAAAERRATETAHSGAGTVLGWNFEIPRPEPDALPFASISPAAQGDAHDVPAPTDARPEPGPLPEDDIAGPFARS